LTKGPKHPVFENCFHCLRNLAPPLTIQF
jgi:hypothetical protein